MGKFIDLTGQTFGRWKVLNIAFRKNGKIYYHCQCQCENKTEKDKETSVSKDKYSKYTLTSKDTYYVVSRQGDTLMYLDVDGSYKNEVDSILSELGF